MARSDHLARLLLVDNNPDYIDPVRDRLIDEGWEASVASSPEEALERVRGERYHVCILDKRLRDDHDASDRSGIDLIPVLWRADGLLHFILLTGYPEWLEFTRLMQGSFPTRQRCCDGYVPKEEGIEALIREVGRVEKESLTLDWDLAVREQLNLEAVLEPLLRETEIASFGLRESLIRDTELLLQWISYDRPNTRFELLDARGRSGARILRAQADNGPVWMLKLATRLAVEEEWDNFKDYVEAIMGHRPEISAGRCQVGSHLGTITYSRVSEIDPKTRLHDLASFLADPGTTPSAARDAIQRVVLIARPWYDSSAGHRTTGLHDLTAYYTAHFQLTEGELAQRFRNLNFEIEEVIQSPTLGGEEIGGEVMNPLPFLARGRFLLESDWNICHGHLIASNILMPLGVPWLIDFASTGPGPTCLDWVTLEASLKFDHSWPATSDLWFRFEEALASQETLDEPPIPPADLNPDLARLFEAVVMLRTEVARRAQPKSGSLEYLVGLLYATAHQGHFLWQEDGNTKAYRLLASAGLIAERLAGMGASRTDVRFVYSWTSSGLSDLSHWTPVHHPMIDALDTDLLLGTILREPVPEARLEILRITHEKLLHSMLSEILERRPPGVRKLNLDECFVQLGKIKTAIRDLWSSR